MLTGSVKEDTRAGVSLAEQLTKSREEAVLLKIEVAKLLGEERSSLTRYESGEREPTFRKICQMAALYKTSLSSLLELSDGDTRVVQESHLKKLNSVGGRVRALREKRNLSRKAIADFCGISQGTLVAIELRSAQTNWRNLVALSNEHNVSLHQLVFGS